MNCRLENLELLLEFKFRGHAVPPAVDASMAVARAYVHCAPNRLGDEMLAAKLAIGAHRADDELTRMMIPRVERAIVHSSGTPLNEAAVVLCITTTLAAIGAGAVVITRRTADGDTDITDEVEADRKARLRCLES